LFKVNTRVGDLRDSFQFCDFTGACYQKRRSLCFGPDIADYIEAVHADDFGTAIGQIAMGEDKRMRLNRVSGCSLGRHRKMLDAWVSPTDSSTPF
jgi:hypothetical protein